MTFPRMVPWFVLSTLLMLGSGAGLARADEPDAPASTPDPAARQQARERFARGLHLFENGDNSGALAEFEKAHQLFPNRLVMYNIGLVYAALGKSVEAVQFLNEVLSEPGSLKPEQLIRARATKEEHERRVGELDVKVNVPAAIEIDGVRVGNAPREEPLDVAVGDHVVGVFAPGHLPVRQSVTVVAQGKAELTFELQATDAKLAHVQVYCRLPGAEVLLDDVPLGKTPLAGAVTVAPGKRVFEVKRPGYMTVRREITLADGAHGSVSFIPEEDASDTENRGQLRLLAGAGEVRVSVDGQERGVYRKPIELPVGAHLLRLERAGYEPLEREIEVSAGSEVEVKVALRPGKELRAAHLSRARSYRNWGIASLVGGAVIAGGSVALAVWSNGQLPAAESNLDTARAENEAAGCTPGANIPDIRLKTCQQKIDSAQSNVDKYKNLRLGGIAGAGLGTVLIGTGVTLLLVGPDPNLYEGKEDLASTWLPVVTAGPGGATLGLRGRF